jgi:hypothetical protein
MTSGCGLVLSVFHKMNMSIARTIAVPTAMPAIAPDPSAVGLLDSLEGEEEEGGAFEGLELNVATVVVVGLAFVPDVFAVIVAAPTWFT